MFIDHRLLQPNRFSVSI